MGAPTLTTLDLQAKAAKTEHDAERLHLRSLQYLERYLSLVLFNAYLHLEKAASWQRPFSIWMREVRRLWAQRHIGLVSCLVSSAFGSCNRL